LTEASKFHQDTSRRNAGVAYTQDKEAEFKTCCAVVRLLTGSQLEGCVSTSTFSL